MPKQLASHREYTQFVKDLADRYHRLINQDRHEHFRYSAGPNYMILEDTSRHKESFTIIWADTHGKPQGMIDLLWIRNPVPGALGGMFETRLYVDSPHRQKGIASKLYQQALTFTKALQQKASMQAGGPAPCMVVEDLLVPSTKEYKEVREGMIRLLRRYHFTQSSDNPHLFTRILGSDSSPSFSASPSPR